MVARPMASVGRDGNSIADGIERLRSLVHATTQPILVHAYDDGALGGSAPGSPST